MVLERKVMERKALSENLLSMPPVAISASMWVSSAGSSLAFEDPGTANFEVTGSTSPRIYLSIISCSSLGLFAITIPSP